MFSDYLYYVLWKSFVHVPLETMLPLFKLIFIVVYLIYNVVLVSAYSKVNQSYIYIYMYPLFFTFFSHIGHYRVLSRVLCAKLPC